MKNECISIIVPVYNSEKYLSRCVDSIINQSYTNFELLLIDDGSSDNSFKLCKEYSVLDKRIKCYSKNNEGVSSARNYGLKKISSKYVCFVDSDDYISGNFLEILMNNLKKTDSDLSVCGYKRFKDELKENEQIDNNPKVIDKIDAYNEMIKNNQFAGYVWNKLYKVDLINRMKENFFKGTMIEDFEFNSRLLNECNKIVYSLTPLYFYYYNSESLSGSFNVNENIINGIDSYYSILNQYDSNNIPTSDLVAYGCIKFMLNLHYRIFKSNYITNRKIIDKKIYDRVMQSKIIGFKDKIVLFLRYRFPILSYSFKKKTNII